MENPGFLQQLKLVSTSANYWLIFFPPLLFSGLIIGLTLNHIYPFDRSEIITKNVLEEYALHVTISLSFMCLIGFLLSKDMFFLWASGLMVLFVFREIHPPPANIDT